MLLNARTIQNSLRKTERILLAIEDGAVLIDGDVIEKLGVHLPLSKNLPEVGRSGTRHTAALGLAECCDALVIVVSEERGTFSVAEESRLTAIESVGELKHKLDGFYGRRVQTPKELARRNWLTANLRLKLLAGATACGLWFLFAYDAETIRRTFHDVPIELRNVPDSWVVHDTFPSVAQVTLSGSERAFAKLNPADLKASIDLSSVRGSADILLTEEHFKVPTGLSLEHLDPPQVQVRTERLVSVDLPVWHAQSAALGVASAKQSAAFPRTPVTPFDDSRRASRTGTQGRRPPGKVELERPKPAIGALRRGAERSESLSAAIRLQWRGEFNGRADCFSGYVSARLLRRIDAESLARNCPIQAPGDQKTINRKRSNACRIPI